MKKTGTGKQTAPATRGSVYCPMCTHTVDAEVVHVGRRVIVKPGQKCSRCASSLDAGFIFRADQAA